jgi:hypothetical protein
LPRSTSPRLAEAEKRIGAADFYPYIEEADLYELFVMGRPRLVKIGASIGYFDRDEEELWRVVDTLRTDKQWYA